MSKSGLIIISLKQDLLHELTVHLRVRVLNDETDLIRTEQTLVRARSTRENARIHALDGVRFNLLCD